MPQLTPAEFWGIVTTVAVAMAFAMAMSKGSKRKAYARQLRREIEAEHDENLNILQSEMDSINDQYWDLVFSGARHTAPGVNRGTLIEIDRLKELGRQRNEVFQRWGLERQQYLEKLKEIEADGKRAR